MGRNVLALLGKRKFLPFFLTQFLGAFNDNAFKLSMLTLISYRLTQVQAVSEYYQAIASIIFILPFFLFSAIAGQLADKYNKALLIRIIKLAEVGFMIIGSFALYYGSVFWMMFTLAGMGTHSTFMGPIKYAIIPDHLEQDELLGGTSLVDASTFVAILLGTTLGSLAIGVEGAPYTAIFMTVIAALCGLLASVFIPPAPAAYPSLRVDFLFWRATRDLLIQALAYKKILFVILILSWFWLIGTILLTKLPDYTHYVLGADNTVFALFLTLFSVGLATGSLAVNLILRGKIILTIVPWAMIAFTFFALDLALISKQTMTTDLLTIHTYFEQFRNWRIAADFFLMAMSCGLFLVPLYTYLEVKSPPKIRARVIATNNLYNSLFMVLGTLLVMLLLHWQVTIPQVFLSVALATLLIAAAIGILLKRIDMQ
ncbi:MAG: MFS transporter [Legionella sp. 40-6]|nr:MFS transporter [Legionella sp.]OJY20644.1 MAG: MFS transporter [Legionella sp. 40-6]